MALLLLVHLRYAASDCHKTLFVVEEEIGKLASLLIHDVRIAEDKDGPVILIFQRGRDRLEDVEFGDVSRPGHGLRCGGLYAQKAYVMCRLRSCMLRNTRCLVVCEWCRDVQ